MAGLDLRSCYGTVEDIRTKHFRHHVENDDVVWFDYEVSQEAPLVYRVTIFLEWCHLCPLHPDAHHHGFGIHHPATTQQLRNVGVIAVRFGLLAALAWYAPAAFIGYLIAYMLMIVVRFVDGLEHDTLSDQPTLTRSPSTRRS